MAPNLLPGTLLLWSRIAIALVALLAFQTASAAPLEAGWELSRQESAAGQPYELYQREVEGSGYDRYRLEAVVEEPMERVIQAITIRREDDQYLGEFTTYVTGDLAIDFRPDLHRQAPIFG